MISFQEQRIKVLELLFLGTAANDDCSSNRETQRGVTVNKIKKIQGSYGRTLTMHGASRVLYGSPFERVFWLLWVVGMMSLTAYLGTEYFTKYSDRESRIEKRFRDVKELPIPTITVCDNIQDRITCFNNKTLITEIQYSNLFGDWYRESCGKPIKFFIDCLDCYYENHPSLPWCVVLHLSGTKKQRIESEYIKIAAVVPTYEGQTFMSLFLGDVKNDVVFHSSTPPVIPLHIPKARIIEIKKKIVTKRLPRPFPSNCTSSSSIENFLSVNYSRESCIQSCFLKEMLENCGTVIDRWKPLITTQMKNNAKKNINVTACLSHYLLQFLQYEIPEKCDCDIACETVAFESNIITSIAYSKDNATDISVHFRSMQEISEVEIPEYTFFDYLAEIGGLVGILVGLSVISILEVLVYFVLHIIRCVYR